MCKTLWKSCGYHRCQQLPLMQRQRAGQIINNASIGAYAVSPTAAVYCATKYGERAISEGLRQEVGGYIRVTVIGLGNRIGVGIQHF